MFEYIIILSVLFFIAVLFYKQANEQFEILQTESSRLEELPTLYQDRSPIIISDFQVPALGTFDEMKKRPHILNMTVSPGKTLGNLLQSPELSTFHFSKETAAFLSKESGLSIWFEHHLYESILPSIYTRWIYTNNTGLYIQHRGLFKTTAFQTMIMPTHGTVHVSLLLPKMIPYFPMNWQNRPFKSLTAQDTPLINQIKFVEVIVRKGTILLLPAHCIVDCHSNDAWIFMAEIHHPISRLSV